MSNLKIILQSSLAEIQPVLDVLNRYGPHLASLAQGEAGALVDILVQKDNKKVAAISDVVAKRAEKLKLKRHKSQEVKTWPVYSLHWLVKFRNNLTKIIL